VTGSESPSSVKMRVMPTFRPTSPKVMFLPFQTMPRGRLQLAGFVFFVVTA
jgi:hypothetical protein